MKQQIIKIFAVIVISNTFLASCKRQPVNIEANNDIKFDSISVNEQYYMLGDSSNPHCTLKASFLYPAEYADKVVLQKVQRQFINAFFGDDNENETPQQAMEKYAIGYINDYKALEEDFRNEIENTGEKPTDESWFAYYETSYNKIIYNKCNLLSFSVSVEYFTGNSNGGHSINNYVINLQNGDSIKEEDIFADEYQDELAKIIVDAIAADNGLTNPEELENMGFFNIKEIYPNNNFYIDDNGITYTFNEYEIAAYFVGPISVTLPYENIRYLIREDSPLTYIVSEKK